MANSYLDKEGLLYLLTLLKQKFFSSAGGTVSGNVTVTGSLTANGATTLKGTSTAPTPANSDNSTKIATTAFVNSVVNSKIAAADAMIFKGTIGSSGATVTELPATHSTGWTYKVITAGTYAGMKCEIGDMIVCLTDGTAANNSHWTVIQTNIDGAVTGPASATANHIATFSDAAGKVIKDSGFTIGKSVPSNAVFTDTHFTTHLKVGAASNATANAAATNGNVWLNVLDNTTVRDSHNIVGSGAATVTSDTNGKITINSVNTTYTNMKGATTEAAGAAGLTPAPAAGAANRYLRSDGTWQVPPNTTYAAATQQTAGLMSTADKIKLDGIATQANKYIHPTNAGNKHIPAGGSSGQILRWSADGTAVWGADNNTTYSNMKAATASAAGAAGLVPAPAAGANVKFLRGDGTFAEPTIISNSEIDSLIASSL